MHPLIDSLALGHVSEVKVVLASALAAAALYQAALMAVGWGVVKLPYLAPRPASRAHRALGDAIVVVTLVVAAMCVGYFGFEDDASLHVIAAIALLATLALKVAVIRWWHAMGRFLPALGISVWLLLALTWLTSAGDFLADA